ncbi:MAG: nucleoside-diphosphate kinase [Chloroflexota bacterium]
MERTLIIVKPDAIQRGLAGEILARLERRGVHVAGLKMIQITPEMAARHYAEHEGKGFYPGLIRYITSAPVIVAALEGPNAIAAVRQSMGSTKPVEAAPGSIRGDLALTVAFNLVHGSDSPTSAERELALFFQPEELHSYQRDIDRWIAE